MWMTDGGLWKAAAVALLRQIAVCGELGCTSLGMESDEIARSEGDPWPLTSLVRTMRGG